MATLNLKRGTYTVKAAHASNVASLSGTGTFGGTALVAGDKVLLTAQSTASQNGPYFVRAGAWDRIAHEGTLRTGDEWYVETGTYAGKTYQLTTANPITLGSTSLAIAQAGGSGMAPATHASTHQNGGADVLTSHATTPANRVWAGPSTGADAGPSFRALVAADIPAGLNNAQLGSEAPGATAAKVGLGVSNVNGSNTGGLHQAYEGGASLKSFVVGTAAVKELTYHQDVVDDATISLPAPTTLGRLVVNSDAEGASYIIKTDGSAVLIAGTANAVITDTDAKLCVFGSGGVPTIRNRLGATKRLLAHYLFD